MAGEKVIISRTGFTNELGWEIYFRPENNIEMLGDLILEEGARNGNDPDSDAWLSLP